MFKKSLISMILLAALVWYYDAHVVVPSLHTGALSEAESKLLPVSTSREIGTIGLVRSGKPKLTLRREGNGWMLIEPHRDEVSTLMVGGMAVALAQARKMNMFATKLEDFERYELTRPFLSVEVGLLGEDERRLLLVGLKHPLNDAYYARWADRPEETFQLGGRLVQVLDKSEYALREKRIFRFHAEDVERISVFLFGTSAELERGESGAWRLVNRPEEKVDFARVEDYLDRFRNLYVKEFLDEDPAENPTFGISGSPNSVTLLLKSGSAQMLTIGSPADRKNAYYARRGPGEQPLILAAKSNVHHLAARQNEFTLAGS